MILDSGVFYCIGGVTNDLTPTVGRPWMYRSKKMAIATPFSNTIEKIVLWPKHVSSFLLALFFAKCARLPQPRTLRKEAQGERGGWHVPPKERRMGVLNISKTQLKKIAIVTPFKSTNETTSYVGFDVVPLCSWIVKSAFGGPATKVLPCWI